MGYSENATHAGALYGLTREPDSWRAAWGQALRVSSYSDASRQDVHALPFELVLQKATEQPWYPNSCAWGQTAARVRALLVEYEYSTGTSSMGRKSSVVHHEMICGAYLMLINKSSPIWSVGLLRLLHSDASRLLRTSPSLRGFMLRGERFRLCLVRIRLQHGTEFICGASQLHANQQRHLSRAFG